MLAGRGCRPDAQPARAGRQFGAGTARSLPAWPGGDAAARVSLAGRVSSRGRAALSIGAEASGGHGERGKWCDRKRNGTHGNSQDGYAGVVGRGAAAPTPVLWAGALGHDQPSTVKNPSRRRYMLAKTYALEIRLGRPQAQTAAGRCAGRPRDTWRERWAIRGQDQPVRDGKGWPGPAWSRAIDAHFKALHSWAATRASARSR